jgi:CPA2 family monovalent cation:H+ antiporter-2
MVDMAAFKEPIIILTAAAIVVPLFHRFKISPVLGFILCGILLGPSGLGGLAIQDPWLNAFTIQDRASIAMMAEMGIVFLLFVNLNLTNKIRTLPIASSRYLEKAFFLDFPRVVFHY